jgi:hypothetical protein
MTGPCQNFNRNLIYYLDCAMRMSISLSVSQAFWKVLTVLTGPHHRPTLGISDRQAAKKHVVAQFFVNLDRGPSPPAMVVSHSVV